MKKTGKVKKITALLFMLVMLFSLSMAVSAASSDDSKATETTEASAETQSESSETSAKAYASGVLLAFASAAGALGMAYAIGKSVSAISRQPEAESKIRTTLMLGLVFIETAIIYGLIIGILIIFVL